MPKKREKKAKKDNSSIILLHFSRRFINISARSTSPSLSSQIYRALGSKCFHRAKWNPTLPFLLSRYKIGKGIDNILKVTTELNASLKPSFPLPFLTAWFNHEKCKMASRHFTRARRQRCGRNTWQPDISHSLVQFFLLQFF